MAIKNNFDFSLKILIVGESGVGKTCLLLRFTEDTFTQNHQTTIGLDFKQKTLFIDNNIVKVQVWDTAGQERFRTLTKSYYKMADGIILTYDVTNRNSFESIQAWLKQVEQMAEKSVCKLIVGNKCDIEERRVVSYDEGLAFSKDHSIPFFETSAKDNLKVLDAFTSLTERIMKKSAMIEASESGRISLQKNNDQLLFNGDSKCSC